MLQYLSGWLTTTGRHSTPLRRGFVLGFFVRLCVKGLCSWHCYCCHCNTLVLFELRSSVHWQMIPRQYLVHTWQIQTEGLWRHQWKVCVDWVTTRDMLLDVTIQLVRTTTLLLWRTPSQAPSCLSSVLDLVRWLRPSVCGWAIYAVLCLITTGFSCC